MKLSKRAEKLRSLEIGESATFKPSQGQNLTQLRQWVINQAKSVNGHRERRSNNGPFVRYSTNRVGKDQIKATRLDDWEWSQ